LNAEHGDDGTDVRSHWSPWSVANCSACCGVSKTDAKRITRSCEARPMPVLMETDEA